MNLDIENWKQFRIGDLFEIENGKKYPSDMRESGKLPLISTSAQNNGVSDHIATRKDHVYSNFLTVAYSGSVGATFYHKENVFVGETVFALLPKFKCNEYIGYFLSTILNFENYRYDYGRKIVGSKYIDFVIKLPTTEQGTPDWKFMEEYIKSLHCKPLTTKNKSENNLKLNTNEWKPFEIGELFDVQLSKGDLKLNEVDCGIIPLISSGDTNNGYIGKISKIGDGKAEIFTKNKITLDMFGNAYYQDKDFFAVSHGRVNILSPKFELNKYIGLFIIPIIEMEQYKYSYGRAIYSKVAENMIINLPATEQGIPDWKFMEQYIKSLPYGDRL